MQQFFENLRGNLDSLENLPLEERAALIGKKEYTAGECDDSNRRTQTTSYPHPRTRKHSYHTESKAFRPPATAAYLHAIRNQRPSHRIRNFVANAEPLTLRGSNYYDPSYLWSGLGRRR
ncbi:UNVERIFIED_CONTAM: hypothetical protein PYX00_000049 [Menopon gallinae]|uniref:Uncharacterized protein n=1 Tax=Menopon gallinae TaxID=328185 RepID=A0AAW2I6Z3_9NEOP